MTVVVGQDTAKTRRTLNMGSKSIAYYSIPAAQAAGLGDFSRLPRRAESGVGKYAAV
jgi:aconitate hydratase